MFVQNLSEKLSDSTQDLGKILDCIYKFPQNQRKQYFQKINALKNQLAGLKSNLREANALQTERQYNTLILALTTLKNQIQDQKSINSNKENRNSHQSGFIRESRRTHEEALRLIAQKDEEIGKLKLQIFEKEELIRINYEELKDYQRDCYYLTEENKNLKRSIKQYEKELVSMNSELTVVSREVVDLRHLSEDQDMQIRMNSEIIQKNTNQLMLARNRILQFQQLADLNMRKANLVEQNVRKVEQQAATLNDNYKQKQEQSLRREKEMESLNMQRREMQSMIERLQDENSRLIDETSLLQKEINLLQKTLYDQRKENKQGKQSLQDQISELYLKVRDLQTEKKEKLAQLQLFQNKFIEVYQRCEEREFEKETLQKQIEQLRIIDSSSLQKLEELASSLEAVQKENLFLKRQKDILNQQVEKAISVNKQSQSHIQQLKEKIKNYQVERLKSSQKVSTSELQLKQAETAKINYEITLENFRRQINEHKEKIIMLEDEKKSSERTILDIKKRLLKAKIEAVREIRVTMRE